MYRKMKERVTNVVLCVMVCFSLICMPVVADEPALETVDQSSIQLRYVQPESANVTLSISSGTASCKTSMVSKTSKLLKITMSLQKYTSGSWKTVKTWSGSKTGTLYSLSKKATVSKGKYRVKASMKSGTEAFTKYSKTVTY